jgi:hypothetical protein
VEGIATLFVFGHASGCLALVLKAVVRTFSFARMLPSIHGFWLGKVLNSCCGYNITDAFANKLAHQISVFINVIVRRYAEHIPVHVIKAVLKLGIRLVGPALNRPEHGRFLF